MRSAILVLCLTAFATAQAQDGDAAALQRQGYRRYEGRWRLPQEIRYLQLAARKRALAAAVRPVAPVAPVAAAPRRLSPQPKRASSTGIFTIHLQHVDQLGIDTVPVSFGTGQGRLQLPRTQSISIGTTVALPLR